MDGEKQAPTDRRTPHHVRRIRNQLFCFRFASRNSGALPTNRWWLCGSVRVPLCITFDLDGISCVCVVDFSAFHCNFEIRLVLSASHSMLVYVHNSVILFHALFFFLLLQPHRPDFIFAEAKAIRREETKRFERKHTHTDECNTLRRAAIFGCIRRVCRLFVESERTA